ncbi:MAG TPA: hypothetical protein ENN77_01645 [Candidatus Wirthbacteria bacterium]|nr:hypothetical protein [Candidatus Wirthbacteria bacterium]
MFLYIYATVLVWVLFLFYPWYLNLQASKQLPAGFGKVSEHVWLFLQFLGLCAWLYLMVNEMVIYVANPAKGVFSIIH